MLKNIQIVSTVMLFLASSTGFASVVYDVDVNGQLLGANGIAIDDELFDVRFETGTCIEVFNGCDDADDFFFQSIEEALPASMSLLEQVFIDTELGLFDSMPTLTNGCVNIGFNRCTVVTPIPILVGNLVGMSSMSNYETILNDDYVTGMLLIRYDLPLSAIGTWAIWSEHSPAPVPVPGAALWFMLSSCGMLSLFSKKTKQ